MKFEDYGLKNDGAVLILEASGNNAAQAKKPRNLLLIS